MNEVDKAIEKLESELVLQHGFFDLLYEEDDWSFIIKCHALMESACSFLLTEYFNKPNYDDIFSRLEMSDKKRGKVAFLRAAGLVTPEEAKFIIGLSELRNRLIHNIHGVGFSFSEYVSSLNKNQRQAFANSFGYVHIDFDENSKLIVKDDNIVFRDPKLAILNGLKAILAIIKLQVETKDFKRISRMYEHMLSLKKRST